jgi:hypothetical protein
MSSLPKVLYRGYVVADDKTQDNKILMSAKDLRD